MSRILRVDSLDTVPMLDQYRAWIIVVQGIVVKNRFTGVVGVPA